MQHRARITGNESAASVTVAGPLSLQDVAARTSSSLSTSVKYNSSAGNVSVGNVSLEDSSVEGALFDETAASYARLRTKTENVIADLLGQAVRDALKAYVRGSVTYIVRRYFSQILSKVR